MSIIDLTHSDLTNSDLTNSDLTNSDDDFAEFARSLEEKEQEIDCPICLESFNSNNPNLVKSCCGHYYCQPCYDRINVCALCRKNLNKHNQHMHNQHGYNQNNQINQNNIQIPQLNGENDGIRTYATNYNVLRIMSGLSALSYSN